MGENAILAREKVRSRIPWWAKGALKLTLSRLPVKYSTLRSVSLAQHGGMERPRYAYDIFRLHYDDADFRRKGDGFTMLELGPGDSLFMSLIAGAHGASCTYHVDVERCINPEVDIYRRMAQFLQERGLTAPDLQLARSLDDVMSACNAHYLTNGLKSLRSIRDASVDYIFSNSVLQHVWRRDLPEMLSQLRRVIRPDGCCVHSLDLRDMMGQSLNHLRFPKRVWESEWFRHAAFYTNRLVLPEFLRAFREAGFAAEVIENNCWPQLPVRRKSLALPYREMPEEDLLVATVRVILRPHG